MHETTGLHISVITARPQGPAVKIKQESQDWPRGPHADERTSFRFFTNDNDARKKLGLKPKQFPMDLGGYYIRDRDLGQSFTTPSDLPPFKLSAITLRTGAADKAVGAGAKGAHVSLQLFTVSGTPKIHVFGDEKQPHAGDYITGEHYDSLGVLAGGILPTELVNCQWLRWEVTGEAVVLKPNSKYAFLVMFDEAAPERELALANLLHGVQESGGQAIGGHGIRREGSIAQPWEHPKDWVNSVEASSLPSKWEDRLALPPGTWGRPDVDTYRLLTFYIEGAE
jgi:hypothetical protein